MGHDTHFLERLERLDVPEAEAALGLYRSPGLVRFVLEQARVPDNAERIAIELAPSREGKTGPWLVVARDGGFVTCLGRGMNASKLPVVQNAEWLRLQRRFATLADVVARAEDIQSDRVALRRIFRSLGRSAQWFTREEFREARAVSPLLTVELMRMYREINRHLSLLDTPWTRMAQRLTRAKKSPNAEQKHELTLLWQGVWALSHIDVLLADTDAAMASLVDDQSYLAALHNKDSSLPALLSTLHLRWGLCGNMRRVAWTAGRRAQWVVPWLKQQLRATESTHPCFMAAWALGAAAASLRHKRYAAELRKALAAAAGGELGLDSEGSALTKLNRALITIIHFDALKEAENASTFREAIVQDFMACAKIGTRSGLAGTSAELGPSDADLISHIATHPFAFAHPRELSILVIGISLLATAAAEDLFPSAQCVEDITYRDHATFALVMLTRRERFLPMLVRPQKNETPAPSRNDPCPCNSGKKYKRCCGA